LVISNNKSYLVSISNSDNNQELLGALEVFLDQYKYQKHILDIPLSLFSNRKLGVLEVTVKYLKENQNMKYSEIAKILNRDERTIWTTYSKAVKKNKELFTAKKDITISVSIFTNRNLAPLKALITSLKNKGMNLTQISKKLNRSYKTIWTTYNQ
jgi:predicted transcriptional regulator